MGAAAAADPAAALQEYQEHLFTDVTTDPTMTDAEGTTVITRVAEISEAQADGTPELFLP